MNSFLPDGYEAPISGGGYMKLQDGDNLLRTLSSAIVGYQYWTNDDKPVRSRVAFETTPDIRVKDGKADKPKHFWAFVVWNYSTKAVEILEVTQASIRKAITNLVEDSEWGDPKQYDIKINRSGSGFDTEYTVSPKPHKEVAEEILKAYEETPINLEALYEGKNPFEAGNF